MKILIILAIILFVSGCVESPNYGEEVLTDFDNESELFEVAFWINESSQYDFGEIKKEILSDLNKEDVNIISIKSNSFLIKTTKRVIDLLSNDDRINKIYSVKQVGEKLEKLNGPKVKIELDKEIYLKGETVKIKLINDSYQAAFFVNDIKYQVLKFSDDKWTDVRLGGHSNECVDGKLPDIYSYFMSQPMPTCIWLEDNEVEFEWNQYYYEQVQGKCGKDNYSWWEPAQSNPGLYKIQSCYFINPDKATCYSNKDFNGPQESFCVEKEFEIAKPVDLYEEVNTDNLTPVGVPELSDKYIEINYFETTEEPGCSNNLSIKNSGDIEIISEKFVQDKHKIVKKTIDKKISRKRLELLANYMKENGFNESMLNYYQDVCNEDSSCYNNQIWLETTIGNQSYKITREIDDTPDEEAHRYTLTRVQKKVRSFIDKELLCPIKQFDKELECIINTDCYDDYSETFDMCISGNEEESNSCKNVLCSKENYCNSRLIVLCNDCLETQKPLMKKTLENQTYLYQCLVDFYGYTPQRKIMYSINSPYDSICSEETCYAIGASNGYGAINVYGIPGVYRKGQRGVQNEEDIGYSIYTMTSVFAYNMGKVPTGWFISGLSIYTESRLSCSKNILFYNSPNDSRIDRLGIKNYLDIKKGIKTLDEVAPIKEGLTHKRNPIVIGAMFFGALEYDYGCDTNCVKQIIKNLRESEYRTISDSVIKQESEKATGRNLYSLFELLDI